MPVLALSTFNWHVKQIYTTYFFLFILYRNSSYLPNHLGFFCKYFIFGWRTYFYIFLLSKQFLVLTNYFFTTLVDSSSFNIKEVVLNTDSLINRIGEVYKEDKHEQLTVTQINQVVYSTRFQELKSLVKFSTFFDKKVRYKKWKPSFNRKMSRYNVKVFSLFSKLNGSLLKNQNLKKNLKSYKFIKKHGLFLKSFIGLSKNFPKFFKKAALIKAAKVSVITKADFQSYISNLIVMSPENLRNLTLILNISYWTSKLVLLLKYEQKYGGLYFDSLNNTVKVHNLYGQSQLKLPDFKALFGEPHEFKYLCLLRDYVLKYNYETKFVKNRRFLMKMVCFAVLNYFNIHISGFNLQVKFKTDSVDSVLKRNYLTYNLRNDEFVTWLYLATKYQYNSKYKKSLGGTLDFVPRGYRNPVKIKFNEDSYYNRFYKKFYTSIFFDLVPYYRPFINGTFFDSFSIKNLSKNCMLATSLFGDNLPKTVKSSLSESIIPINGVSNSLKKNKKNFIFSASFLKTANPGMSVESVYKNRKYRTYKNSGLEYDVKKYNWHRLSYKQFRHKFKKATFFKRRKYSFKSQSTGGVKSISIITNNKRLNLPSSRSFNLNSRFFKFIYKLSKRGVLTIKRKLLLKYITLSNKKHFKKIIQNRKRIIMLCGLVNYLSKKGVKQFSFSGSWKRKDGSKIKFTKKSPKNISKKQRKKKVVLVKKVKYKVVNKKRKKFIKKSIKVNTLPFIKLRRYILGRSRYIGINSLRKVKSILKTPIVKARRETLKGFSKVISFEKPSADLSLVPFFDTLRRYDKNINWINPLDTKLFAVSKINPLNSEISYVRVKRKDAIKARKKAKRLQKLKKLQKKTNFVQFSTRFRYLVNFKKYRNNLFCTFSQINPNVVGGQRVIFSISTAKFSRHFSKRTGFLLNGIIRRFFIKIVRYFNTQKLSIANNKQFKKFKHFKKRKNNKHHVNLNNVSQKYNWGNYTSSRKQWRSAIHRVNSFIRKNKIYTSKFEFISTLSKKLFINIKRHQRKMKRLVKKRNKLILLSNSKKNNFDCSNFRIKLLKKSSFQNWKKKNFVNSATNVVLNQSVFTNEKSKQVFRQTYTLASIKRYLKKNNKTLSLKNLKSLKTYYAQKHVSKLRVILKHVSCYKYLKNKLIKQKIFTSLAYKVLMNALKSWKQKINRRKKFILKFNLLKNKEIFKGKVSKRKIRLNYVKKQKLMSKRRTFVLHKVMLNILRKRARFEFIKLNKKLPKTKENLSKVYKKLKFKNLTIKSQRNRFYFLWNKIHNRTERFTIIFKFNGKFQKKSRRLYRLANGIFKDIWFKKMFHFNSARAFNGCRLRKLRRKKRASRFVTFRAGAK